MKSDVPKIPTGCVDVFDGRHKQVPATRPPISQFRLDDSQHPIVLESDGRTTSNSYPFVPSFDCSCLVRCIHPSHQADMKFRSRERQSHTCSALNRRRLQESNTLDNIFGFVVGAVYRQPTRISPGKIVADGCLIAQISVSASNQIVYYLSPSPVPN